MRKRLRSGISMLLALSMLCVSLEGIVPVNFAESNSITASAADSDYGFASGTITGYTGSSTELDIPSAINGVAVTAIAAGAFSGNTSITSVKIPEGVTTIGCKAFYNCTSLKSVSIPSTVTAWDDNTSNSFNGDNFYGCTALTSLTLAEGLTTLGQRAFYGCTALTSVVIPSTISEFHNYVFGECTSLTDITLSEGMTEMGHKAFYGCTSLKEITIPSTITSWSKLRASGITAVIHECNPFYNCTALESVTFTDGLTTLYDFYGFKGCSSLKEVTIPDSVTDISYGFINSDYLEKVILGSGLTSVSHSAFLNCTALKEVVIPDTVTSFDHYAFQGCSSLEKLVLPKNFSSIQGSSLLGCSSLKTVLFLSDSAWYNTKFVATSDTKIYAISGTATYSSFLAGMSSAGTVSQLVKLPSDDIKAVAYEGEYDGNTHEALELSGVVDGVEVMYSLDGGEVSTEIPKIKDIGTYSIDVFKKYEEIDTLILVDTVEAKISKASATIKLNDITVDEGKDYIVEPESYDGDGKLVYTYYKDAALTQECEKPTAAGTYYVKAVSEETENYLAGESNTAKIVISKKAVPTANPTNTVKPSVNNPTAKPTTKSIAKTTRSQKDVAADKAVAEKIMKQAKITKLIVNSKTKKKITATWKKVKKATGYEVQVSANKKFKKSKIIYDKMTAKKKLTIKNSKIKSKKTYYVRVRAYATYKDANNTPIKVYSNWNKQLRKVKVK